ncbi:MAG: LysM domain-containing protein [Caldilineales bacterium]
MYQCTTTRGKFAVLLAAVALFALMLATTTAAFASGEGPTKPAPTICVSGYVINHREDPVDGTKFDPPLMVNMMTAESLDQAKAGKFEVENVTIGADGKYHFEGLAAGLVYNFSIDLPEDWDGIVPLADKGGTAETGWTFLPERKGCYDVLFKIRRWYHVIVLKWEEQRNGTVSKGQGWSMTATPQGDPWAVKQTGQTDSTGSVVLYLTPGKWTIKETLKSGWTPITPPEVTINLPYYGGGGALDPVIFKNLEPVCYANLTVQKIGYGTNAEGEQEYLGPLYGWSIMLSRVDGAMAPVSRGTDGMGKAYFSNLQPGVYQIRETVQSGWQALTANPYTLLISDCNPYSVTLENLEVAGHITISGTKYFRAWVPPYKGKIVGLAGWRITATLKGAYPVASISTYTDALGNYVFSEADLTAAGIAIPGATVQVCEEIRDHWIPVSPTCVDVKLPYPLPATYTGEVVNFTNMQDPPPDVMHGTSSYQPAAQPTASAGCNSTYQVRYGDNLLSIAQASGMTVNALLQLNNLSNPNYIRAGQTLCVN